MAVIERYKHVGLRSINHLMSVLVFWSRGCSGHFERGTRRNDVPMVAKLPERMGVAFPLLKCLRMHHGRHCEPFSG